MMAQVMQMRLSQALDSSTVRPFLEKFISSRATLAVITAAMVLDGDDLAVDIVHDLLGLGPHRFSSGKGMDAAHGHHGGYHRSPVHPPADSVWLADRGLAVGISLFQFHWIPPVSKLAAYPRGDMHKMRTVKIQGDSRPASEDERRLLLCRIEF